MKHHWADYLPLFLRRRIEGRGQLQGILSNITWLSFDRVLRLGVGLVVGVWLARYLGPDQFGIWNYAIAFSALFGVLSGLGLDNVVIKELVNKTISAPRVLGSSFVLRFCTSIATMAAAIVAVTLARPQDGFMVGLVAITAAGHVFLSFDVIDLWFQSRVLSRYVVLARNIVLLIMSAFKVGLIVMKAPLIAFVWLALCEVGMAALGLIIVYTRKGESLLQWRVDVSTSKMLLRQSWPLLVAAVSITIYMKIDQVMLGSMIGDDAVGIYSAATRLSELWYFIPSAIAASVFPSVLRTRSENKELYYQRLQKLFDAMTALAVVIAIPITFASTPVIEVLFGDRYSSAGPVLSVHIWAAVFVFLGVAQGCWDVAENLTKLSMFRTMLGAGINVILNLVLIPKYQALGAAVATLIAYGISAYVLNVVNIKTRPIFVQQTRSFLLYRYLQPKQ